MVQRVMGAAVYYSAEVVYLRRRVVEGGLQVCAGPRLVFHGHVQMLVPIVVPLEMDAEGS